MSSLPSAARPVGSIAAPRSGVKAAGPPWASTVLCFFCSALSAPGQSYLLALYVEPLIAELSLHRVYLSSLYAGITLAAAAALIPVGRLADRWPAGRFLGGCLAVLGCGLALLATAWGPVQVALAFFLLRLAGQGAIGVGTLAATLRWLGRSRGARILAFVTLGYAFGEAVVPRLVAGLQTFTGWRGSLAWMSAAYLLVFAPLVGWTFPRPRPGSDVAEAQVGTGRQSSVRGNRSSLGETARRPLFWILVAASSLPPVAVTGLFLHQVALFAARGWDPADLPQALLAYAVISAGATFAAGHLLERVQPRIGLATSLAALSLALLIPLLFPGAGSLAALGYGALLGFSLGTLGSTNSVLWPVYFGRASIGSLKAVVSAARNGSAALGPVLVALGSDTFEGPLLLLAVLSAGLALGCARLPRPSV